MRIKKKKWSDFYCSEGIPCFRSEWLSGFKKEQSLFILRINYPYLLEIDLRCLLSLSYFW